MRRRRHVRCVAGAPRGIEADVARRQVGVEVGRQVAGGAIVGADQERRAPGQTTVVFEQGGEEQRGRGARPPP